ncbi:MAG TPA: DUF2232 domain-containing protein [Xanthobacteraceae bacterium]|nr:DUF2232 domain-containing protein [Xanthobacteraceae bacterium]
MTQIVLIGLGAGVASALLFASIASGSVLAILLFYLAPLPILLAGIGWSHFAALIAALAAAAGLGVLFGFWFFIAHLLGIGLPAFILAYVAMLARHSSGGAVEWYPAGKLVLWSAGIAAVSTALTIPVFGTDLDSYRTAVKHILERIIRLQLGTPEGEPLKLPNGGDPNAALELFATVMPLMAAAVSMLTGLFNLWLAGRIARISGRLARPWPDLAAMNFPAMTPVVLLAAIALSFLASIVGVAAGMLAACLLLAYAVLGFAVIHKLTRAFAARGIVLGAVWLFVLVLGWPVLVIALIGLADGLFDLRAANSNPPPNKTD